MLLGRGVGRERESRRGSVWGVEVGRQGFRVGSARHMVDTKASSYFGRFHSGLFRYISLKTSMPSGFPCPMP